MKKYFLAHPWRCLNALAFIGDGVVAMSLGHVFWGSGIIIGTLCYMADILEIEKTIA